MSSSILSRIRNDADDAYRGVHSIPEYIESTLNDERELYKYLAINSDLGFVENIIRDNTIKFGNPSQFNDPFDCMSVIGITSFNDTKRMLEELAGCSGRQFSNESYERAYDDIVRRTVADFRTKSLGKYGLLSLSGKWDNILMWGHYANSHTGLVTVFQFNKTHEFYQRMMKVQYRRGITYFEMDHANCGKKIWESFSTKDPIWEYENEYRVISIPSGPHMNDGNGIKSFPRELLKGFIFGFKMCPKARGDIIKMVSTHYPTLQLSDIVIDDSEVKLHKVAIN